jgi:3-hydroxyacyl-CoA dehydrogenase/3-hydroxy-2-methylbutyryl-CoA dehydrogenase
MNISKVVAFITGAGQGLGRATAIRLARGGAKVTLADTNEHAIKGLEKEIGKQNAFSFVTDVSSESGVSSAMDAALTKWGALNVIINCAGICIPMKVLSSRGIHTLDHFQRTIGINTVGTFNVIRLGAMHIANCDADKDGLRGCIINTASIAAYEGQIGQTAYAASKGAIISMTLPLARELSSNGIRVNTIAPGLFLTPLMEALPRKVKDDMAATVPLPRRLGNPEEYAQLVECILMNPMINGETIRLDGAMRMPHQP